MSKTAAEHHKKASEHLTRAAQLHGQAAKDHEVGSDEAAIEHTQAAKSHTIRATDHADKALQAYVEHIQLLMGEVRHRAKNMLSLVEAIARQTATGAPETFMARFNERIRALAANQDLLVRNEQGGIAVDDLVRAQLVHFKDLVGHRIILRGTPTLRLNPAAAQVIGLATHELATNASKYGALSVDAGRIDVGWQRDGDKFAMSWVEHDGPRVSPPKKPGFGTTVIRSLPQMTIGGEVQLDYPPSGLTWHLTCPAAKAMDRSR